MLLTRAAQVSIGVQHHIWQADTTGWPLLEELRATAGRDVRVRLLLDTGIPELAPVLAALADHPGIEVRLFNTFTFRRPKLLAHGFDFARLNGRMHNKAMTVDGLAVILGGSNIGDNSFPDGAGTACFGRGVLGVGQIAADVAADFDRYWASEPAWPAEHPLCPLRRTGLVRPGVEPAAEGTVLELRTRSGQGGGAVLTGMLIGSIARWDGCRPPLTASQCAKVVVFKATQAGRTAR